MAKKITPLKLQRRVNNLLSLRNHWVNCIWKKNEYLITNGFSFNHSDSSVSKFESKIAKSKMAFQNEFDFIVSMGYNKDQLQMKLDFE